MHKLKYFVQQSWLLIVASFLFGLLIAITNTAWAPRIEQNRIDKLNRLMQELMSDANSFEMVAEDVEIAGKKGKVTKTNIYRGVDSSQQCVGFGFIAVGAGFADKIELIIAVDAKFEKFLGFNVLSSNETPGFGDKIKNEYLRNQFKGVPAEKITLTRSGDNTKIDSQIVAITGATISSDAVVEIFNNYVDTMKEHLQSKELI